MRWALALLLFACDGESSSSPPSEVDQVRATFGELSTVAGKGDLSDKEVNGWDSAFEGADALTAELSRPHMTMADRAGNLYIADKDAHAIRRVGLDGRITTVAGASAPGDGPEGPATEAGLNAPNGLWVQPDGTLFILDLGNSAIRRVSPAGELTTVLVDPEGMDTGRGLWVDAAGEHIIYAAGTALREWRAGAGVRTVADGFVSLGNLTVDPQGVTVVTDRGGNRVYRVEDGQRVPIAGNGLTSGGGDGEPALATGLAEVRAIAFHPAGGYFLGTHRGSQLWYVDTAGTIHLFIDGDPSDDTRAGDGERFDSKGEKLSEIRAVVLTSDGDLLITENDRGFIRRVAGR